MKNRELARIFAEIANALEYKGEAIHRVIAYRRASRVLGDLSEDVEALARRGRLREIRGVGERIAGEIEEYLETGRVKRHEEALSGVPEELLGLMKVQNLGPKTLALAQRELGVENLDDLKRVIGDGSLAKLFGMGEKRVENIAKGIEAFERGRARIPISEAVEVSEEVIEYLMTCPEVSRVAPAGSLRRMRETVGDIDILATGRNGRGIIDFFTRHPRVIRVLSSGGTKSSVIVGVGREERQVDLRVVPEEAYGAALQYFTGSKQHNIRLRTMAREMGLKVSEYGVFRGTERTAGRTEEDVYKALGLPYIPPELREDRGEIEAALAGKLPELIESPDVKGDLHVHSTYSDGNSTIREMAEEAGALGYEYLAICDHSKSVRYAGGLTEEELKEQMEEIDDLNEELDGVRILKGTEVDILKDGSLDFSEELLEQLDVVVAAVHMGFRVNVTERIVSALEYPCVDVIAHPTGRLISRREGYDVDVEKVLGKAKECGKALELNAYYDRLDLDELNLRRAKEMGVRISMGTDAHSRGDMGWMRFGVGTARRGWLEKRDVINTLILDQVLEVFGH